MYSFVNIKKKQVYSFSITSCFYAKKKKIEFLIPGPKGSGSVVRAGEAGLGVENKFTIIDPLNPSSSGMS